MAYTAVISLKQTIHRLLNSSNISLVSSTRLILLSSYQHLQSLQEALRISDASRSRLNHLDEEIREALHQFEDELEFHVLNQLTISSPTLPLELDLKEIWLQETNSFPEAVKKMTKDYTQELNHTSSKDDAAAAAPSQTSVSDVKMVGLSDLLTALKEDLTRILRPDDFAFFSFYGMAGIGRSIVAKSVYDDLYAVGKEQSFDCGAWVRIGSTSQLKQILLDIIAQLNDDHHHLVLEEEDKLSEYLYSRLEGKRYIIALDDVRGTDIVVRLRRSFPEQNNGSLVFVTTDLIEVAEFDENFYAYELPTVMDEEFVWNYIRLSMFSMEESISEFEEAGKKIAKNCGGRILVLARVMLLLMRSGNRRVPEFWVELAADEKYASVFTVDDEISETNQLKNYVRSIDKDWFQDLFNFSNTITRIKSQHLFPERLFSKMGIRSIYGMAGIGKTTLIKKLLQDPSILRRFDHCVWINVGSNYKPEHILKDILVQIDPDIDQTNVKEDVELAKSLTTRLSDKKCLIVLDDLWSQEPVHYLKRFMPNIKGELMVTTRLYNVAIFGWYDWSYKVPLLNEEESWNLFRERVFGNETCPYKLEKIGKKIVENCEGLPLLIIAIADLLSKNEKTLEYWCVVAERKNEVFKNALDEVSKALFSSYESLPQYLKACFLYMGVFPEKHKISTSNLIKLWFAEGLLEPNPSQTFKDFASRCLKELFNNSMVMVQQGSNLATNKTCALHNTFWHLSNTEAIKNKFFHTLSANDETSMESRKSQRRLCIRNSILLGIEDVYDEMAALSTSRVLLCTGTYHQYQVPLYYGSRLLRVLDALAIRFYEFPVEVTKLVFLRYLALTCNGEIPSSISKLWNLQFLIVRHHLSIHSSKDSSYLPKEVWNMKELKHLQITGSKLPSPHSGALLPNLSSLFVSVHSCTPRIFKGFPNLKKLGIQIEFAPDDHTNFSHWLNHISYLGELESLKCVVVNPELGLELVAPCISPKFPTLLKKLSLSGLGFPWEYMTVIGKLQNLEALKLRCYAFQGPIWEIDYHDFSNLKSLSIEDADLERWDVKIPSISNLRSLSFKDCYNLEHLPLYLPVQVKKLEVIDSHPSAEKWAKQMREMNWEKKLRTLEPHIQSPWCDGKRI